MWSRAVILSFLHRLIAILYLCLMARRSNVTRLLNIRDFG